MDFHYPNNAIKYTKKMQYWYIKGIHVVRRTLQPSALIVSTLKLLEYPTSGLYKPRPLGITNSRQLHSLLRAPLLRYSPLQCRSLRQGSALVPPTLFLGSAP